MIKIKTLALISTILAFAAIGAAQNAAPQKPAAQHTAPAPAKAEVNKEAGPTSAHPSKTSLPTTEQVDAYMKRNFGYDPGVTWEVLAVRESVVPGIAELIVSVNKGAPYHLYYSPSTQTAFVGQMLPFGPDPFAPARAKLRGAFGPSRGAANGPIQIVEFSDLECPHCKKAQPIVEKLQADFPQVQFTFQQFPLPATLHPWAMKAALYADCAGQMNKDSFWKYVDAVFENQGSIALATADDKLKELAVATGYDALEISRCAASPETDARVQKSLALGQALEVNQTPTVYVNGRTVLAIADIPYENLKKLVQFEIEHAGK